jgi:hypothetical protein
VEGLYKFPPARMPHEFLLGDAQRVYTGQVAAVEAHLLGEGSLALPEWGCDAAYPWASRFLRLCCMPNCGSATGCAVY